MVRCFLLIALIFSVSTFADSYDTLGVKKEATQAEIHAAYRQLITRLVKERKDGDSTAQEKIVAVEGAYRNLKDSQSRFLYDILDDGLKGQREENKEAYRHYHEANIATLKELQAAAKGTEESVVLSAFEKTQNIAEATPLEFYRRLMLFSQSDLASPALFSGVWKASAKNLEPSQRIFLGEFLTTLPLRDGANAPVMEAIHKDVRRLRRSHHKVFQPAGMEGWTDKILGVGADFFCRLANRLINGGLD